MHIIRDSDLGLKPKQVTKWRDRATVRAIVFRDKKIAIIHFRKNDIHMLPGGAIDGKESPIEALHREIKEELGSTVKIIAELGTVEELRSHIPRRQIAYGFLCEEIGRGTPSYTKIEEENDVHVKWISIAEARKLFKTPRPSYNARFRQARDLYFLEQSNMENK